jgi:hypothetical protein
MTTLETKTKESNMNTAKLMLHCGANRISREQLATIPTPGRTDTWQPVPHAYLVDQVERALANTSLRIVAEDHAVTPDNHRYFGLLQVANCNNAPDYSFVVGLRNSDDKSIRASLGVGMAVFVCDNLSFSAEITMHRKHTPRIMEDFPNLTARAIGKLAEKWNEQTVRVDSYKRTEISDAAAHDILVRAYDNGVLPITRMPVALKEWKTPSHPEFSEGKTVWRLFNAVTESLKGNLWALPNRTTSLHGLCDQASGILQNN